VTDETLRLLVALAMPTCALLGGGIASMIRSTWKDLVAKAAAAQLAEEEAKREAKARAKADARALRELRYRLEARAGRPSVHPPPAPEDEEERTGVYEAMRSEDLAWLEREREVRPLRLVDRLLKRADERDPEEWTPTDTDRPRPRQKSRPDR
jgi:hypothetical protein